MTLNIASCGEMEFRTKEDHLLIYSYSTGIKSRLIHYIHIYTGEKFLSIYFL